MPPQGVSPVSSTMDALLRCLTSPLGEAEKLEKKKTRTTEHAVLLQLAFGRRLSRLTHAVHHHQQPSPAAGKSPAPQQITYVPTAATDGAAGSQADAHRA